MTNLMEETMIKDILVHLEGNSEDKVRLAYAQLLGVTHDAHVSGILLNIIPDNVYSAGYGSMLAAQAVSQIQEGALKNGDEAEENLVKQLKKMSVNTDLRRLDVSYAQAGLKLASEARTCDILVATRPYNHHSAAPELLEEVLFNSGRGVFFTPPAIKPVGEIDQVVLAWSNTRESARAVNAAMPIMVAAKNVTIAMVSEDKTPEEEKPQKEILGADIARHLNRHGINAEIRYISGWKNPADALLNEVEKTNSKLLVMGGYGHSRFREWILGGVTRDILREAEVPVLLSH